MGRFCGNSFNMARQLKQGREEGGSQAREQQQSLCRPAAERVTEDKRGCRGQESLQRLWKFVGGREKVGGTRRDLKQKVREP